LFMFGLPRYELYKHTQLVKQLSHSYVNLNEDGSIFINGKLTPTLLEDFQKLTTELDLTGRRVVVRSLGGYGIVGIELGNIIFDNKMDIEIDSICVSACANYLFTAARNKYISEKTGIIFHGGATQEDLKERFANRDLWGADNTAASVQQLTVQE